jgi:CO/xanthine dehydrogenase FAD-binding subunit
LLASDEDARVISGGQTLVPMLAMRLARPARLVDIYRLPELNGIRIDGDILAIGATASGTGRTQRDRSGRATVACESSALGRTSTKPVTGELSVDLSPTQTRRLDSAGCCHASG